MAVKPITNKQVVSRGFVSREKQVSTRNISGNQSKTVVPGLNFGKNNSITLKDIDTSIISYVKNVINPKIREANESIKVPVMYGNEERWKSVRKRGVLRDTQGTIILPLIMLKRTETTYNDTMIKSDHDIENEYHHIVRSNKWSKQNRYDRFSVQQGTQPINNMIVTGVPDFVVCNYSFVILTNFIEQMNQLSELFIEHANKYWGDSTEYKFLSKIEGGISDASELTVDGERLIKNEFSVTVNAYLSPEFTENILGKIAETKMVQTVGKVVFNNEIQQISDD
tara:strand:+ start:429 stop:1274 length:846 start_codon:yes stop_codon:yes gene_type:complete